MTKATRADPLVGASALDPGKGRAAEGRNEENATVLLRLAGHRYLSIKSGPEHCPQGAIF